MRGSLFAVLGRVFVEDVGRGLVFQLKETAAVGVGRDRTVLVVLVIELVRNAIWQIVERCQGGFMEIRLLKEV